MPPGGVGRARRRDRRLGGALRRHHRDHRAGRARGRRHPVPHDDGHRRGGRRSRSRCVIALTLTPALLGFAGERLTPGRRKAAARGQAARRRRGGGRRAGAARRAPRRRARHRAADARARRHRRDPAAASSAAGSARHPRSRSSRSSRSSSRSASRAIPALQLRLALPDAGSQPEGSPARVTYDLVAEHFGAGLQRPAHRHRLDHPSTDPRRPDDRTRRRDRATCPASPPCRSPPRTRPPTPASCRSCPTTRPDSARRPPTLVAEIRVDAPPLPRRVRRRPRGHRATRPRRSTSPSRLGGALLPFGMLVVGLSLVLLTMVFRSHRGADQGDARLPALGRRGVRRGRRSVFEWGWFADALHVDKTGPIISFMPIILMGVLFGLAMDYEVFLVSRIREDYVHGGDARRAIQSGFVGSAKVVTAAAIIMISVFAAFVPEGDASIKPIALGLAVGVVRRRLHRADDARAGRAAAARRQGVVDAALARPHPALVRRGGRRPAEGARARRLAGARSDRLVAAADGLDASTARRAPLVGDVSFRLGDGEVLVVHGGDRTAAVAPPHGDHRAHARRQRHRQGRGLRPADPRLRGALPHLGRAPRLVGRPRSTTSAARSTAARSCSRSTPSTPSPTRWSAAASTPSSTAALSRARVEDRPFALVVSCVDPSGLDDLLPRTRRADRRRPRRRPEPSGRRTASDPSDTDRAEHGAHLEKADAR